MYFERNMHRSRGEGLWLFSPNMAIHVYNNKQSLPAAYVAKEFILFDLLFKNKACILYI